MFLTGNSKFFNIRVVLLRYTPLLVTLGFAISLCNIKGQTETDSKEINNLKTAAEAGDASAQFRLGVNYDLGEGVAENHVEAVKWYRRAAEQDVPEAQYNLGLNYINGDGVTKNRGEAVKWFRKAAEQNVAGAQTNLGYCYGHGVGVHEDLVEAAKWYRKAAEQNDALAEYNLGLCYDDGTGVTKSYVAAANWYRKSAEQNNAAAQYNLGVCYAFGNGVAKNEIESYKWWLLAGGQGNEMAKHNMSVMETKMTRGQIAEGQKLAGDFRPKEEVPPPESDKSRTSAQESRPVASGSGFLITEDGYVVTNEHVVRGGTRVRLVTTSGVVSAKVVKVEAANDLALLKTEGKFAALPVASSRPVKLGETVATLGFPNPGLQGFAPKFAKGEIGSLSGLQDDARYFQISVPVQPGNSGGALVDEYGNVVGVVSAKLSAKAALSTSGELPENVNYAVKSSFLLGFLESVPEIADKLKEPNTKATDFANVVEQAKESAVLVLVY